MGWSCSSLDHRKLGWGGSGLGVALGQLLPGAVQVKEPVDASPGVVALLLPGSDLAFQHGAVGNPAVEALLAEHPDLDLHQIEPASVLGSVVKLRTLGQT